MTHTWRNGTQTTSHANVKKQHNGARHSQKQCNEKLKSMDMKFHWLRCQKNRGNFRDLWVPGTKNKVGYVTKHNVAIHHRSIRPEFLTPKCQLELLINLQTGQNLQQGCAIHIARQDWQPKITLQRYSEVYLKHQHGEICDCICTVGGSMGKYVKLQSNQPLILGSEKFQKGLYIAHKLAPNLLSISMYKYFLIKFIRAYLPQERNRHINARIWSLTKST